MIASKGRDYDKKIRLNLLEIIGVALRTGRVKEAKEFGEQSRLLAERIKNHDYKKEDEECEIADRMTYGRR